MNDDLESMQDKLSKVSSERNHLVDCISRAAVASDQRGEILPSWLDDTALCIAGVTYRGTRHLHGALTS